MLQMAEFLNDDIDFAAYLQDTDSKTKVKPAFDFIFDAKERLRARAISKRTYLPWTKCNDSFEFRAGEVTIWAGQNGHGKTDFTTQIALSLIGQDEKVCVASFEMKPVTTIGRMVRMYAMTNPFSEEYQSQDGLAVLDALYDDFGEWTRNRLWLYDQTGTASPEVVLGMIKYCGNELGITHVFIDSLMKCIKNEDDHNGQKSFVDSVCAIAKDSNVHIHLVHHLKKPQKESDMPDKHDTKGSGSITDQVDNLFMVWRNKPKEDDLRANGSMSKKKTEPDSYLLCRKQRNYEGNADGEPMISLWRHRDAGQFVSDAGASPQFFPNYPHHQSTYE
jgi:twinkle protein